MQKPKHNHVTHGNCEHLKSGILSKEVRCYDKYLCSCQFCKRWGIWWSLLLRSLEKAESEKICDYTMRETICSQVISYGTSILQLTKWDWVCFYLSPYIPILKKKGTAYFFFPWEKFLIDSLLWNPKVMTQSITNMIAWWHISTCNSGYLVEFVDTDQFLRIGQKNHQV